MDFSPLITASMPDIFLNDVLHIAKPGSVKHDCGQQMGCNKERSRGSESLAGSSSRLYDEIPRLYQSPSDLSTTSTITGTTSTSSSSSSEKQLLEVPALNRCPFRQPVSKSLKIESTEDRPMHSLQTQDEENREDPIYLDELSQLLLEEVHKDNPRVVIRALEQLAILCHESQDLCTQACGMGAPTIIVSIMKKWTLQINSHAKLFQPSIQVNCFRVLIAMTVGDDSVAIRNTLWMFIGCNTILSLLPSCGSDGENWNKAQKSGLWMGRRFVRAYNGIKTILKAMLQFEQDRELQQAICSVVLKLAAFMHAGKDRQLLLESGAISAFSVAYESNSTDDVIQHYMTLFMTFMSGDD